jgi:hypothetical protein
MPAGTAFKERQDDNQASEYGQYKGHRFIPDRKGSIPPEWAGLRGFREGCTGSLQEEILYRKLWMPDELQRQ